MTDFMSFVRPALSILEDSNYDVFLALGELNFSNLKVNLGFHFAVGYVLLFSFLLILFSLLDCRQFRNRFEEQLYLALHKDDETKPNTASHANTTHISSSFGQNGGASVYPESNEVSKEVSMDNYKEEEIGSCVSEGITFGDPHHKVKMNSFFEGKGGISSLKKSKFASNDSEGPQSSETGTSVMASSTSKIKRRLNSILAEERTRKSCCCLFQRLARNELATNNQTYNLFATSSPLSRRNTRLMFCYLGILVEFSLCALFFNLSPQAANSPDAVDELITNVWVGLFSTLFTVIPLVILGCFFSFPKKWAKQLSMADSSELKQSYVRYVKRIQCRVACNVVSFVLLSIFLLLYIVCFCHVATPSMAREWVTSSAISMGLDIAIFEVSAAFGFAFCGVIKSFCRSSSAPICFIIFLELYRLYRNLVEA